MLIKMFRRQRDELPALPGSEDEEVKLLRQRLKEVQTTNREQGVRLKEKEAQLARLRELNRELRRGNKGSGQVRSEDIEEVRRTLADKENKLQVGICKTDSRIKYYQTKTMTYI